MSLHLAVCFKDEEQGMYFIESVKHPGMILDPPYFCIVTSLLLDMECSKIALKSEQFLLTLGMIAFLLALSVNRSAPTEAVLAKLCWQGCAACASETVLLIAVTCRFGDAGV